MKNSFSYQNVTKENYQRKNEKLLSTMPKWCAAYSSYLSTKGCAVSTVFTYLQALSAFLAFSPSSSLSSSRMTPGHLRSDFVDAWVGFIEKKREKTISASQQKIQNAMMRSLLSFLQESGCDFDFSMEEFKKHLHFSYSSTALSVQPHFLTDDQLQALFAGVEKDDKYLATSPPRIEIVPISMKVWVQREFFVYRNLAILSLLSDTGIKLSELVGLDLSDIDLAKNQIRISSSDFTNRSLSFSSRTFRYLHAYLNGVQMPDVYHAYAAKNMDYIAFCKTHLKHLDLRSEIIQEFGTADPELIRDLTQICFALRRQGREQLKPEKNCEAVFLSKRGSRMTGRAVQMMVKEMLTTYLPEVPDITEYSPSSLRSSFALRIFQETESIERVSELLQHENTTVTETLYGKVLGGKKSGEEEGKNEK